MSDIIQVADLEKTKFHNTFHVEAVTGKVGGLAGGADIDFTTNAVTGQVQATLPKLLSQVGFAPAYFDFTTGGILTNRSQSIFYEADGNWYSWGGALPKTVAPLSSPASTGGIAVNAWNISTSAFMYRDYQGVKDELYNQAGIIDDGTPNQLGDSQFVGALHAIFDTIGTLAEVTSGKFQLGKIVFITERNAPFKIEIGTPDGYGKVAAGGMNIAVVQVQDVWCPRAFGASMDGTTDDTLPVKAMVDSINHSNVGHVNVDLNGLSTTIVGDGIFKFTRKITKFSVINGVIIWKPTMVDDALFTIDVFVERIFTDIDVYTDTDTPDNIPRGDIFYFISEQGDYASTHNSFTDMFIRGSNINYAPIRNIFNTQGYGNNDQSKVSNCRFESFYTIFRCNNPESVGWVFDMCGVFTVTTNPKMFWFDTLSSGFTIKRSSFSLIEQTAANYQTLLYLKSNNVTNPPSDEAMFILDNVRIETYSGAGTENIRILDIDFGKVTITNCLTNAGNDVQHDFRIAGNSAVYIENSQLGTTQFITVDSVQVPPYQPDFLTIKNGSCRNIPAIVSNAQPIAYEYLDLPFDSKRAVFENVTDVVSGKILNFKSYARQGGPTLIETLPKPNDFSILQPLSMVDSIRFKYSKIVPASYPKVRLTVAKGNYVVSFDLPTAAGDFELLPTDYFLMYLFDHNDTNLSLIKFQLLDSANLPSVAEIEAEIQISYIPLSYRVAAVVGAMDAAKIANIYGAPL